MSRIRVGVWGGKGSFTEEAASHYIFKQGISEYALLHFPTIESEIDALQSGQLTHAVFPIRNTIGGNVMEAKDAFESNASRVIDTFEMDIHQNLLALRGTAPQQISTITSHAQPLMQCKEYLEEQWSNADIIFCSDMSEVAAELADGTLPASTAIIGSQRLADIFGLQVLTRDIQDKTPNRTTFVVLE